MNEEQESLGNIPYLHYYDLFAVSCSILFTKLQKDVLTRITLLFYQIEPLKNGASLILPSSIAKNS